MTAETELPAYLPYPRFLLKMDISHTAKLLYALLLDRSTLSQKNGWQDSEGRTYIVYPIAEIAEMLDKGCTTIKGALNELDAAGLLELCMQHLFIIIFFCFSSFMHVKNGKKNPLPSLWL